MAKVSIHLVTWNGEKYLESCFTSILKQTFDDYFLLVIDNGSADNTVKMIEEQYAPLFGQKIRFIKNKDNFGFAKAHNQALLWTDSDYVLILNQDVILAENYLAEAVKFLDQNESAAAVTGKILRADFEAAGDLKTLIKTDIIDSLGLNIYKSQRAVEIAAGEKDMGQREKETEVFGVSATCPIYRRKALDDVRFKDEFFDNEFFSYQEDFDLAYRLRWRAWKSFCLASAVCYHKRTARSQEKISSLSLAKLRKYKSKFVNYYSYKNHLFVLLKNLSVSNFFHCFFQITFYEFSKFIFILFFEWQTLAGLKDFFGKFKSLREKRNFIMKNRLVNDAQIRKWFV